MTHATFKPQQGHFKWYKTTWQTEDAQLTDVGDGDALRFRVCIVETGGAAGSSLDINVEYSTDKSTWYTLGAQGATDKKFRWRDDTGLTEHAGIDQARLSCTTENGLIHENACIDSESVAANAHHEISIILEPYQPAGNTVYYFRVVLEGTALALNAEVSEYVNLKTVVTGQDFFQTVEDKAGLLDLIAKKQAFKKEISELTGLLDSASLKADYVQSAFEMAGLLESVSFVATYFNMASDVAGLADSVIIVHTPADPSGGDSSFYFHYRKKHAGKPLAPLAPTVDESIWRKPSEEELIIRDFLKAKKRHFE